MGRPRLLAIDDAPEFLNALRQVLQDDYDIVTATSSRAGLEILKSSSFDTVLLDVHLNPGENGMNTLEEIISFASAPPVVMITSENEATIAVDAWKKGAFDYIVKPPNRDRLLTTVRNAVDKRIRERERTRLLEETRNRYHLVGESPALKRVEEIAVRVATSELPVLITGETGTGKEIVGNLVHYSSGRMGGKLVQINMASIPVDLLESELFGHEKGGFTGAVAMKEGLFETAEGGTVFLDEIGLATHPVQAKILHAIERKPLRRVGGTRDISIDVRVIAATSRRLEVEIELGNFLPDLYYRLNGVNIHIPPLRERPEDILAIAEHYLKLTAAKQGTHFRSLSADARLVLMNYDWPGNVRELINVVQRLLLFSQSEELSDLDVTEQLQLTHASSAPREDTKYKEARETWERDFLKKALASHNHNVSATARDLGLDRANLHKKLASLGIEPRQV